MTARVWRFPRPPGGARPAVLPSPFGHDPHPLAREAAALLLADLAAGLPGIDLGPLADRGGGKMFGVLVVEDGAGALGYLRAFSGMLDGAWTQPGFAPPLFDQAARDAMWPAGQAVLRDHELALRALAVDPAALALRAQLAAARSADAVATAALRARHAATKAARRDERARLDAADLPAEARAAARHALDQASRADTAERRQLEAGQVATAEIAAAVATLDARRSALEVLRAEESRQLMLQVHDHYVITSARGERRPLRALYTPAEPPGGAGDCAAPKLLGAAYRQGLRPVALAEVWWGAPPLTGGRHAGAFYPACRGKCGPLLPFMLDGLPHEAGPVFGGGAIGPEEPRVVFEDAWIVVVDKPCGLLSVPGRGGGLRDCVQARLRARYPAATGPLVVHRLDLDTSGLLIAAKDLPTHAAIQAQFARREVTKRYVAWLAGDVAADAGRIELPLRGDLDDRPRQIVDPVHGLAATTTYEVLARQGGRTRVALAPATGRTHQLRVHAAHPDGLGAPIVGDRLYGRAGDDDGRLRLHAEHLALVHPHTGARLVVDCPAPF